ncbi:helix-turn-helix domain-containing protein [Frankia sp. QA3]|uniref:AraC-like ligand-binding domain-containing protein n=1 Tax=Frankia sp. QA3 TaxID=710111 RepID=UPI0018DED301|nr:helix-turn-helix domain-containing protein [Frankia sp. QA3]
MSRTHAPLQLDSECAANFRAHQRLIGLGAVSVWPATFEQLVFMRTPRLIRQSDPEVYHLSLMLRGEAVASWGRQGSSYQPFDFHTNDSSRPYEIWTGQGPISSVGIEIPKALLPIPGNKVDQVIGQHMSGRAGIGALLAQFLTTLAADAGHYQPTDGPRLGTVLVDLVATMFAHTLEAEPALPPETRARTLTLRIKAFIRSNLHDPDLTPGHIAAVHHVSRGYLHRLFQAEADTVASYIRSQRLEGARRDLIDPALRATPVHVIATRWGFPRAADFTRAFRTAYGTTPTDHRQQAPSLPGQAS